MCKKELLDKAFTEAVTEVNVNMMSDKGVAFEAIETFMKAFAEREKADFTDDEITLSAKQTFHHHIHIYRLKYQVLM